MSSSPGGALRRCSARLPGQEVGRATTPCGASVSDPPADEPFSNIAVSPSAIRRLPRNRRDRDTPRVVSTPESKQSFSTNAVVTPSVDEACLPSSPTVGVSELKAVFPVHCYQRDGGFRDLGVLPAELRPSATLTTGQCFHWRVIAAAVDDETRPSAAKKTKMSAWGSHDAAEWLGTLRVPVTGESVVVVIRETPETVLYRTLYAPQSVDVQSFLYSYFQLPTNGSLGPERVSLRDLYREWSTQCDRLRQIALCLPGVRIVDQDPWETLVSFICSSNNNIPRITKILDAIRRNYGDPLLTVSPMCFDGKRIVGMDDNNDVVALYSFPSLVQLQRLATNADLRTKCGMGYRAKYLLETMQTLTDLGGEMYLQELRLVKDPIIVQEKLTQFCGIGRKVADCIALFSLQQTDAIPVDVHVWNIARRDYGAESFIQSAKSLTPTIYRQIGDLFRSRFPSRSGWAHSLLFVAELPSFRQALRVELVDEMDQVRSKFVR